MQGIIPNEAVLRAEAAERLAEHRPRLVLAAQFGAEARQSSTMKPRPLLFLAHTDNVQRRRPGCIAWLEPKFRVARNTAGTIEDVTRKGLRRNAGQGR